MAKQPSKTVRLSQNAAERFKRATLRVEANLQALPLHGRRGAKPTGGGAATIIGTVAVAIEDIPEPTEVTAESLPAAVRELLPESYNQPIYLLGQSTCQSYTIVVSDDGGPVELYALPPNDGADPIAIYNTAGTVSADRLLQCKAIDMDNNQYLLVDVVKCD
jgi:hypothetical protein